MPQSGERGYKMNGIAMPHCACEHLCPACHTHLHAKGERVRRGVVFVMMHRDMVRAGRSETDGLIDMLDRAASRWLYNGSKNLDTQTGANTLDSRRYEKTLFTRTQDPDRACRAA